MFTHVAKAISILVLLPLYSLFAQEITDQQRINQAVFNKVEYHLNQQETDSIYAMTGKTFRQAFSAAALQSLLAKELYPLGRIQTAVPVAFEQNTGIYKLGFNGTALQLTLSLDSLNLIERFGLQPDKTTPKEEMAKGTASDNSELIFERKIDSIANAYIRKGNTHALAFGMIKAGKTSNYFYGETQKGNKQLPDESTLFEIGSISKTFTATLLAYLAEKQQVSLDDTITKYLPDSLAHNPDLQKITLQQLANHTSGLPRMPSDFAAVTAADSLNPYALYHQEHLYAYLSKYEASGEPGSTYVYSNLGYAVLGTILSNISGKNYNEMVQEVIAQPLELGNTTEHPDAKQNFIPVHNQKGETTPHWTFRAFAAAGALKSTVMDLLRYAKAHFKMPETDLEKALALTRQFTFFNPPDTDIGLAWHMVMQGGSLVYQHTGGTYGSSSYIAFSPDKNIAVVVLSNSSEKVDSTGNAILEFLISSEK